MHRHWSQLVPNMSADTTSEDMKQHYLPMREWRSAVRREIHAEQRGVVKTLVRAARKLHFSTSVTGGGGQIQTQNKCLTIYLGCEDSTWQRGDFLELVAETQHCMAETQHLWPKHNTG